MSGAIQNWGTKWNASGAEVLDGRLSFLTALERAETDSGKAVTDVPLHHDPSCLGR